MLKKPKTTHKKHADIELGHSAYTDNDGIKDKVWLRQKAIEGLDHVSVLDLFAGDNTIWKNIKTDHYVGVDKDGDKGENIRADNRQVIKGLDLSMFNVIDCDAYGIPYEQIQMLFENDTLQKGTVVIYTCITGVLNRICVRALDDYGIQEEYKRSRVLYNPYSKDMFDSMLRSHGITKTYSFTKSKTMKKEYGFFVV